MKSTHQILGSDLSENDKEFVKRVFTHRFTGDNVPSWSQEEWRDGKSYPLQFKDDADWLAHTLFAVNRSGTLNRNVAYCESAPTWPNGNPQENVNV